MLSILLINKKLCRAEAFSGFLINFPKQNLILITLNNLTITGDKMIIGTNFFKLNGLNSPKKGIFSLKEKRSTSPKKSDI